MKNPNYANFPRQFIVITWLFLGQAGTFRLAVIETPT